MILLRGLPGDEPIANVQRALARKGCPTFFLDERDALDTRIELSSEDPRQGSFRPVTRWSIWRTSPRLINARTARIVFPRCKAMIVGPRLATCTSASADNHGLAGNHPALVVNRSSSMASNGSKPYQAQIIAAHGLSVPETLITTDAEAAREFLCRHGEVIYKSISGIRSIVSRLTSDKMDRLDLLRWCPTQFQEYIAGDDYRVHIVGDEVFSCRIVSTADDYRYAGRQQKSVDIEACEIPADLADASRRVARTMQLHVAGIDLRLHASRGWYCFEVNPSPAFAYFEDASGLPIGDFIADLLIRGKAR